MRINAGLVLTLLISAVAGCTRGGLRAEPVAASIQRPSNIAFYVRVSEDERPETDLSVSHFTVYEDGAALTAHQTGLTLLDRDVAVAHATLLLVDVSGTNESGAQKLSTLATAFAKETQKTQFVYVYSFDGGPSIREVASFEKGATAEASAIEGLAGSTLDRSRNLHGAVVQGLVELGTKLRRFDKPVVVGSLVVFTAGGDLAGRVSAEQLDTELDRTSHQVYAVGAADERTLERIGRSGTFRAQSLETSEKAFAGAAQRVNAAYASHYLVSYCSPARAGRRDVRIAVSLANRDGKRRTAFFNTRFDATGFDSGCDAKAAPKFVVTLRFDHREALPSAAPERVAAEAPTAPAQPQSISEPAQAPTPKRPTSAKPRPRRTAPPPTKEQPVPAPAPAPASEPAPPADEFEP